MYIIQEVTLTSLKPPSVFFSPTEKRTEKFSDKVMVY